MFELNLQVLGGRGSNLKESKAAQEKRKEKKAKIDHYYKLQDKVHEVSKGYEKSLIESDRRLRQPPAGVNPRDIVKHDGYRVLKKDLEKYQKWQQEIHEAIREANHYRGFVLDA